MPPDPPSSPLDAVGWLLPGQRAAIFQAVEMGACGEDITISDVAASLHRQYDWENWLHSEDLAENVPKVLADSRPLEVAAFVKALSAERLTDALECVVRAALGPSFISRHNPSLQSVLHETGCNTPLMLVLSPGTDPLAELQSLADRTGHVMHTISLGKDQAGRAEATLRECVTAGRWLVLQNLHLYPTCTCVAVTIVNAYMCLLSPTACSVLTNLRLFDVPGLPRLADIVKSLRGLSVRSSNAELPVGDKSNSWFAKHRIRAVHAEFRLILTSFRSPALPARLLQDVTRLVRESGSGLQASVQATLSAHPINSNAFWAEDTDPGPGRLTALQKMVYSVSVLHGLVQQRSWFGPCGWAGSYDFSDSDSRISLLFGRDLIVADQAAEEDADAAVWPLSSVAALRHVLVECSYGGKVTDAVDRRVLTAVSDGTKPVLEYSVYDYTYKHAALTGCTQ